MARTKREYEQIFEDLMEYWEINPFSPQFDGHDDRLKAKCLQRHNIKSTKKFKGKVSNRFLQELIDAGRNFGRERQARLKGRVAEAWYKQPLIERKRDGKWITIRIETYKIKGKTRTMYRDMSTGRFTKKPEQLTKEVTDKW